jgi:hypothetical protein
VAKGVERGGIGFTALKGENRERGDSTSTNTRRNGGRIGIENGIWYTRNCGLKQMGIDRHWYWEFLDFFRMT